MTSKKIADLVQGYVTAVQGDPNVAVVAYRIDPCWLNSRGVLHY